MSHRRARYRSQEISPGADSVKENLIEQICEYIQKTKTSTTEYANIVETKS